MPDPLNAIEEVCTEPEHPCSMCHGEGYVGTGYSTSFVDASDAMECPRCEGTGEEPDA